jgi:hypothetical protein
VESKLSTWLSTPLFAAGLDNEDLLDDRAASTASAAVRVPGRVPKLLRKCSHSCRRLCGWGPCGSVSRAVSPLNRDACAHPIRRGAGDGAMYATRVL